MKNLEIKLLDSYPQDLIERDILPHRNHKHDAGIDLICTEVSDMDKKGNFIYFTSTAVNIPEGYVGFLFMRSSVYKQDTRFNNAVGVIDAGYTGEIKANCNIPLAKYNTDEYKEYAVGNKFAQLVIVPIETPKIKFVSEFTNVAGSRGTKGFGSSDNK